MPLAKSRMIVTNTPRSSRVILDNTGLRDVKNVAAASPAVKQRSAV